MIFVIGDANPRAPIGSSVHGGTEGSNPASSSAESGSLDQLDADANSVA